MVELSAQWWDSLTAHPLPLGRSLRAVGFIRPGPNFGTHTKFTRGSSGGRGLFPWWTTEASTWNSGFVAAALLAVPRMFCVGLIRPGPYKASLERLAVDGWNFDPPLDYIGLEDGTILGDEVYDDPLGIG